MPVDRLEVHGLALPGGPAHRVDGDPVVDPGGGVPGEEVVGQRAEQEVVQVHRHGSGPRPARRAASRNSRLVIPPTSASASSGGGQRLEGGPQMVGGERPVLLLVEDPVQHERPAPPGCPGPRRAGRRRGGPRRPGRAARPRTRRAPARARRTHSTSSKSSASLLLGVSRFSSRSGRCRMTRRSRPASESTWNPMPPS